MTSERAVISLKGGELYVLSLVVDGMRGVKGFHFDRAASSVLTTCLCLCEDNYLFLGSRLGNSLLLQFTEKDLNVKKEQPPSKRSKHTVEGDLDFEVYGQSSVVGSTSKIASYSFEVCDSLLNIGPCGNVSMGEPSFLSEEFAANAKADPDVELVSTSGHGKNGALCVLEQTIRPQIVTTFELPGCHDMWTVVGGSESQSHAFLILSRTDSTMVLQTGEEINELDQSGFNTQLPTVYTGNIGGNKYIIQICSNEARLLEESRQLQRLSLDFGSPLIHASPADPHIVALTADGQLVLLSLDPSAGQLSVVKANLRSQSKMLTICAYKDTSGLFTKDTVRL